MSVCIDDEVKTFECESFSENLLSDQHGNIMALAAERNAQKINGSSVVNTQPIAVVVPETSTANDPTVKKVSRLKHFFSPIRKKSVTAPTPPPIISQPDVFISNMLPNNLYVNPSMLPSNDINQTQYPSPKPGNVAEVTSPTSSFQVRR